MKPKWIAVAILGLVALQASAQAPTTLTTEKDKRSYGIGVQLAMVLKAQGVDTNSALVVKGLQDALSGAKLLMTEDEIRTTLTALQKELDQKQEQEKTAAAENNKKAGEAFLTENKKKEGVMTTASGLQYKVITAAQGPKPTEDDTILCQYKGTLLDGTEFDSSYKSGGPATFLVKGLIPGFKEALLLMPVGSTWEFYIPSELAYGDTGAGEVVGPNATLIFRVELVGIQPKGAGAQH